MEKITLHLEQFHSSIDNLPNEELGRLFREMLYYAQTGVQRDLTIYKGNEKIFHTIEVSRKRAVVGSVKGKNICNQNAVKKRPLQQEQYEQQVQQEPQPEQLQGQFILQGDNNLVIEPPTPPTKPHTSESINYKQLMVYWNTKVEENRSNLPKIRALSEERIQHLTARLKKHSKQDIVTVINNATTSNFFNDSTFACFDWIFQSENNFQKTLDGNYNRTSNKVTSQRLSPMGSLINDLQNEINFGQ